MSGYRLTPGAAKDLDAIADFSLARWGERQTEKYLTDMIRRFEWLDAHPTAERARDEIGEGYRSYRHGSHLIFYIVVNGAVAIIGIAHGSMDILERWSEATRKLLPLNPPRTTHSRSLPVRQYV